MNVRLPADQRKWLEQQVAAGRFSSIEEAVAAAVTGLIVTETDDLAWAKADVDEARAAASRGDVVPLDDAIADIDAYLASLKR
jgi:Arc/MetJ-type ribon-helix-helix transcriptional regulator